MPQSRPSIEWDLMQDHAIARKCIDLVHVINPRGTYEYHEMCRAHTQLYNGLLEVERRLKQARLPWEI